MTLLPCLFNKVPTLLRTSLHGIPRNYLVKHHSPNILPISSYPTIVPFPLHCYGYSALCNKRPEQSHIQCKQVITKRNAVSVASSVVSSSPEFIQPYLKLMRMDKPIGMKSENIIIYKIESSLIHSSSLQP